MSPSSSTTTTEILIQESSSDTRPSNFHDSEISDYTIGRALSSPLFTQEGEDPASRRQAYHSPDEGLSSSQSSSVGHVGTGRKHEFQADYDRRSIPKLNEVIESPKGEVCRAHQGDEQHRRDRQLLHEQLLEQNWDLREAHKKSLNEMEELMRFQGSTFDTISRIRLIEDRDTILELTGKIQELQNEINCMDDSRDFQDAESVRSGQSHVASQPVFFPPHPHAGGMLSRSLGMPSRNNGLPSIWDNTHGLSGNVFADPVASSSAPYPQESNPLVSNVSEHISPHVMSESQTPVQDQRCQSGPSARNSVIFSGGDSSKNYGADQQRVQISELHFDKYSLHQQHSLVER